MESQVSNIVSALMEQVVVIILAGALVSKLAGLIRMPDVVMFVLVGAVLGPAALGLIHLDSAVVNQAILTFGAAYILFDGGREIRLRVLNQVRLSVTLLATVGVLVSAFLTALFAMDFLHLDFIYALLLGATIASTDPSVLVPLFKKIDISDKLKQTIIAESAFNDAVGAIAVFAVLGVISGGSFSLSKSIGELAWTAGGGILVGVVVGVIAVMLVSDKRHGVLNTFIAEVAVAAVAGAYVLATHFGFSGFMAVFVFGIMAGNKDAFKVTVLQESFDAHLHFKDILISIIRMMIFILLGSHIDFAVLIKYGWGSLGVVVLFIFVARSVSVLVSVLPDRKARWSFREIIYLMWVRETGVIPAALAGMLVTMKIPHAQVISSVTCMAIIITLTLQASSSGYLAKKLGLERGKQI